MLYTRLARREIPKCSLKYPYLRPTPRNLDSRKKEKNYNSLYGCLLAAITDSSIFISLFLSYFFDRWLRVRWALHISLSFFSISLYLSFSLILAWPSHLPVPPSHCSAFDDSDVNTYTHASFIHRQATAAQTVRWRCLLDHARPPLPPPRCKETSS